jgi:hypothetical protein
MARQRFFGLPVTTSFDVECDGSAHPKEEQRGLSVFECKVRGPCLLFFLVHGQFHKCAPIGLRRMRRAFSELSDDWARR